MIIHMGRNLNWKCHLLADTLGGKNKEFCAFGVTFLPRSPLTEGLKSRCFEDILPEHQRIGIWGAFYI